ncbi:MAG TPA: hypothetical protein VH247_12250 [Thermoleophilaceae bacterium]|nr:hypothetical protein [Thermoleophilaceae bacterium]
MAQPGRNGGGGLSLRTLAIASSASLTAAIATSRLFPPGTIYASALTPVIVAAVSEMLNRPADRVSELRRQRRTLVMEASRSRYGEEAAALQGAPEFAQGDAADEELGTLTGNGTGHEAPIRIHGRTRSRLLHPKVWIATGLAAFVIAVAVLTLPELIFGGSLAGTHRTTYFGGGSSSSSAKTQTTTTPTTTQKQQTVTETVPAQTPQATQTQTTTTGTQTTPTDTGTSTTPSGGAPAPSSTGTSTTPSGAATPPTP